MKRTVVALAALLCWSAAGRLGAQSENRGQPLLELSWKSPKGAEVGELLETELTIVNVGRLPATAVRVNDILPPGAELIEASPLPERLPGSVEWSFDIIRPSERQVIRMRLKMKPETPAGECRHKVRIVHQVEQDCTFSMELKRPELSLTVTGPEVGLVGEVVPVKLTVANNGNSPAHHVTLAAVLSGGLAHPTGTDLENDLGDLLVGQSRSLMLPLRPTVAGRGRLHVQMTAAGARAVERDLNVESHELKASINVLSPAVCYPGWATTCNFVIHNPGGCVLPASSLEVRLPRGMSFVRTNCQGVYDSSNHTVVWNLPPCNPDEKQVLAINGMIRDGGKLEGSAVLRCGSREVKRTDWALQVDDHGNNVKK